ncbi:MAG: TolC family protein [Acidobacteria bacterium]|nr:TolC family protein [Acidobacteriota bacterium]
MSARWIAAMAGAVVLSAAAPAAQAPHVTPSALRYVDPVDGLSLEQAIADARAREPGLQAARTVVDVARGQRAQARLRPNPSVSFEQRTEPAGRDRQTTGSVEWPLDLFRRAGRARVADEQVRGAALEVANRERLFAADVRARYGEVLAAVRELGILDDLVATTARQLELLRARVEEGASPPLDRDLVELELRRLESDRAIQVGRADLAMIELKRMLGLLPDAAVKLREQLEDAVGGGPAVAAGVDDARAGVDRADVQEARARVGLADARIDVLRREARIDARLFASYMRMDAGFPQRGFTADDRLEPIRGVFHYVAFGAAVTVPILDRNQGAVAAARAARNGAAADYEAARLTAAAEIAAARAQAAQADAAVALFRDRASALARQTLSVVTQSYALGRMTVFDVLAEQRRFLDVERAYTAALRAAFEARTALMRAVGGAR